MRQLSNDKSIRGIGFQPVELKMTGRKPIPRSLAKSGKHRAVFYCRFSLRERTEKHAFRGAKNDTYLPHDAKSESRGGQCGGTDETGVCVKARFDDLHLFSRNHRGFDDGLTASVGK